MHSDDEVYFSYSIPYTYSDLLGFVKRIRNDGFMLESKIGVSLGGIDIIMLTITDY